MWTFGRRIAAGFLLSFAVLAVVGLVSFGQLDTLATTAAQVAERHLVIERLAAIYGELRDAETGQRGFVITGDESFLAPYDAALERLATDLADLRHRTADSPDQSRRFAEAEPSIAAKLRELADTIALRRAQGLEAAQKVVAAGVGKEVMDRIRGTLDAMQAHERRRLDELAADVVSSTATGRGAILVGTLIGLLIVAGAGWFLSRTLSANIGAAVRHVQSSSAELQAAANQQAAGAKEQATAMGQINATITELFATSRQIADGAQRVAAIASRTDGAAKAGDQTVARTREAMTAIRRQVEVIERHMIDLGQTSQRIGGIVELINELAEQTQIIAINASIEAAGAGDHGRRFAVVADEIRRLADRVSGSTREIRALVDEVRGAVDTTVMATETGTKTADAGARQFEDVTAALEHIVAMVATTTDASKEIELTTQQQSSAVEQVITAITSVSQAARETEASSAQTLQTAAQLVTLSRELTRLVQRERLVRGPRPAVSA